MSEDGARSPESKPEPQYKAIRSKYEFVIAAAREAERLNDFYRTRGLQPSDKVTVEAIRRVKESKSRMVYEEPQPVEEETRRESPYFFGS